MKYEELKTKLTEILQEPDTALVKVGSLLDEIKADYETMLSLTEKVGKQDARIRDLQDTNMKLFLSQTGQAPEQAEEEDDVEGPEAITNFINALNKEEE